MKKVKTSTIIWGSRGNGSAASVSIGMVSGDMRFMAVASDGNTAEISFAAIDAASVIAAFIDQHPSPFIMNDVENVLAQKAMKVIRKMAKLIYSTEAELDDDGLLVLDFEVLSCNKDDKWLYSIGHEGELYMTSDISETSEVEEVSENFTIHGLWAIIDGLKKQYNGIKTVIEK